MVLICALVLFLALVAASPAVADAGIGAERAVAVAELAVEGGGDARAGGKAQLEAERAEGRVGGGAGAEHREAGRRNLLERCLGTALRAGLEAIGEAGEGEEIGVSATARRESSLTPASARAVA